MSNEENKSKIENGLPKIAQTNSQNKSFVIVIIITLLVLSFGMYFYTKEKQEAAPSMEETYGPTDSLTGMQKMQTKQSSPVSSGVKPRENKEEMQQQIAFFQEKQKELQLRLSAPLMLVNNNQVSSTSNLAAATKEILRDTNTQFMQEASAQKTEAAITTAIGPLNSVIAEGTLIHASLESAINSDLHGYLRASVREPVYSEDGTQVLIPRGSRLIGQYKSGISQGQARFFIVWMRLITPTGISIHLGSSGVDSLGVSGMGADEINRHFWERFGTASLVSLIGVGPTIVGRNKDTPDSPGSSYRTAISGSFSQSANQILEQDNAIAPTLKTYQGKPIMVFVAKDLHFANAMQQTAHKMNVF